MKAVILCVALASVAGAQSVQYKSPSGIEYRAQADTGPIARALDSLARDPNNVQKIIALGVAQAGVWQFREAIETFSKGLMIAPNDAMLYRWRGHRYLSVRELDRALADLQKGYAIDSTNYGILYHLGIVRFARGEYNEAARLFTMALPRAPNAGEQGGSVDWLWMSLMRAGRTADAKAHLDRKPDTQPNTNAYSTRIKLYRGELRPDQVLAAGDTTNVGRSTLNYGLGNWYLVSGDTANARAAFAASIAAGGWPGFGFILSEIELRRLTRR
ncbi:MAG TPA: tetratricopeptide repeat protein [Thermoanaerobaculia bacterium]|nr:tetratricopeptide repeat protein [Thermoanaerobaculia bacterium]